MRKIFSLILSLYISMSSLYSQMILNRDTTLKIKENGNYFSSPFSGGINSAQFSEIDLNLDGIMDLIVFDKSGNKISPFINTNGYYIYAPKYRENFPDIHDWILLADYNCDGKNDIFTYSSGGMAVFENTSNTYLNFSLITPLVLSDYGSSNINIYISSVDIPAITDVDYDGDLDVLTFSILGGFVEYHRNMSVELTGSCDTIAYQLQESCWGLFYEGLNNYTLNCPNCQCPPIVTPNNNPLKQKHAGSTILAIDIDNDNDKDLILGDVSFNNLNLLINGGDNQNAFMTVVDSVFPQNYNTTIAADMHIYPASYYLDLTNDGVKDLVVTTNGADNSENFESCWLYQNIGQNNNPDFTFIQTDFLQSEMIDLGTGAHPCFYDYNNDNLIDLVVGNYGYHNAYNDPISSLALFKNIGTNTTPEYELINRDWLGISNINLNTTLNIPALNLVPTFGDLDGDGNKDLLIGDANGKLHFFKNLGAGNFQITAPNFQNIDIGYFAHPQIIDVNRDGLNDIIIGEQDGTINYCPNTGTNNIAVFDTIITNFGGIDIEQSYISTGYSSPKLIDSNGVYQLFVGSYSGTIYQFTNIDNNLDGLFTTINSTVNNIWDGGKCAFSLKDITNDNKPEMIIGNLSGGLAYFSSDSMIVMSTWNCIGNSCIDPEDGSGTYNTLSICESNCVSNSINAEQLPSLSIFPNPTKDFITIYAKTKSNKHHTISIHNMLGENLFSENILITNKDNYKKTIDLSSHPRGLYILKMESNKNTLYKKIILQ